MTPTQRKQAQLKLEVLYQRKAKAEAMGPDVIQAHRAAYDQICDEIERLEDGPGAGRRRRGKGRPGAYQGGMPDGVAAGGL